VNQQSSEENLGSHLSFWSPLLLASSKIYLQISLVAEKKEVVLFVAMMC
jgi:hypothetical protein